MSNSVLRQLAAVARQHRLASTLAGGRGTGQRGYLAALRVQEQPFDLVLPQLRALLIDAAGTLISPSEPAAQV